MVNTRKKVGLARSLVNNAKDKVVEAKETVKDKIADNPFISLAVAVAVGAVVALGVNALMKERKRSTFDRFKDYF